MNAAHNDANIFVIDIGSTHTSWGYAGDDDPRQCRTSAFNWNESNSTWSQSPTQLLELREGVNPMRLTEYRNLPGILQRFVSGHELEIGHVGTMADERPPVVQKARPPSLLSTLSKETTRQELQYIDGLVPGETLKNKMILFSEPTKKSSSNSYSKTLGEVSMESMEVEAFFAVRKATLSAFALGRPTALVAETGPMGTIIAPVFEGYTLKNNIQQYAVGGCLTEWLLATSLKLWDPHRNCFAESFWPFGPKQRTGKHSVGGGQSAITSAYLHQARRRVLEDMTQAALVTRENGSAPHGKPPNNQWPANQTGNRRSSNINHDMLDNDEDLDQSGSSTEYGFGQTADIPYELPDGKAVHISKSAAIDITEFIFEPWAVELAGSSSSLLSSTSFGQQTKHYQPQQQQTGSVVAMLSPFEAELTPLLRNWPGLARAMVSTAFTCDVDILPTLMSNIVVGGGPSAMEGYLERTASSLSELSHLDVSYRDRCPWAAATAATAVGADMSVSLRDVSQLKVKVAAQSPFDRRFTTWIGGSILAGLSSFDNFWITRKEWNEFGPNILHKKLVF